MLLPLQDVKIIEMGNFGPSTYGVFMLGDLGAEVVRIKPPPHPSRPKPGSEEYDEDGTAIPPGGVMWHRNKREISLNLRMPEAQQVFYQLARESDVVVEANRPGVLDRLGVGYERVSQINSRIIYCSVTGYGQDGPYKMSPGHDACWTGVAGALYLTGVSLGNLGNRRQRPEVAQRLVTHHAASHYTAMAILAALLARDKTGRGQHVDVSNCDSLVGIPYDPPDKFLAGRSPAWHLYKTKDELYMAVGARDERTWSNLCMALGKEGRAAQLHDESQWEQIAMELQSIFSQRTQRQWWQFFQDKDTVVAPVLSLDKVPNDPQVRQRQMLLDLDLPDGGKTQHYGIVTKLLDTPGQVRSLPPTESQHTNEILKHLSYSEAGIQELRTIGAVR
ncbi:MAG: CoA transferase [Dehalococcoidia bacterium]|nr:CoA transferase [Dehalococcoidia bacterium]